MGATTPDVDGDLPPSAKFVAHVLQKDGPLRLSELRETTGLSERTVHNALDTLEEFYELGR
jgi:transcriptional antiterminator